MKNSPEVRADADILGPVVAGGQHQKLFFQGRQQHVVDLWPRAVKLVVHQGEPFPAGQGQARVNPVVAQFVFLPSSRYG